MPCQPHPKPNRKPPAPPLRQNAAKFQKPELKGASRGMYESMTEKELDEMATAKRSKLPEHADNG